ncbi:MAG: hypothetical protein ACFFDK_09800 [Promethearchaeota archaeon]
MNEIYIILILFPIILIASYITKQILIRYDYGPFSKIIIVLGFIGVAIHELSHFLMCLIVGIKPKEIKIKFRSEITNKPNPHGHVKHDGHKQTFLQQTLISLAPLIISTWLFFWSLMIALNSSYNPLVRIAASFFCLSLILGASPSMPDFQNIWRAFKTNLSYSLYQIFLVLVSGILVWLLLNYYEINLMLDLLFYILIGIMYYLLKYVLMGINYFVYIVIVRHKNGLQNKMYRLLNKQRLKPQKPYKLGNEEAHW